MAKRHFMMLMNTSDSDLLLLLLCRETPVVDDDAALGILEMDRCYASICDRWLGF